MAISDQQIFDWLVANPTADDATIAAIMDQFDVTPADVARATGTDVADIQSRYEAVTETPTAPTVIETPTTGGLNAVSVASEPTYTSYETDSETVYEPVYTPPSVVKTSDVVDTSTAPVITSTETPANQLSGVVLAGASWMAGDEKTKLAEEAFGQNVTNTAIGGQKTSDVLNQLNVFERDGGTFAPGTTVVLDIGANDIAQGVDENTIRNNLNEIVSRLGFQGVNVILSGQPEAHSYDEAIKSTNLKMDDLYSDIAKNNSNVTLVDAMSGMLNQKDLMDESGFHLKDDASKLAYLSKFSDAYKNLNTEDKAASIASLPAAKTTVADTTTGTTKTTDTTTAASLPAVTDYQGNQYDGAQVLTLARQIAENAGTMTGGAFQTKGESIGFDANEANKLLGRTATASEQVLLDMARQFIQSGVTDLNQLKTQDIKTSGVSVQLDPETNQYYALIPSGDGETSTRKELTPDQVAKIKTNEIMGSGEGDGTSVYRTIDDLVTGKGLFANGKLLSQADAVDNPIAYTIGATYTGGGGTSYDLKFDPKTGKSVVSANGFTTSDADTLMPIIMIASNFLMPGVGSALTSSLAQAGLGEVASQVVSRAIINGVTSGVMAESSGGKFGDGFLKGSITGAISAGVAPMISTALPSDLSPAVSTALTRAGTAAITALATGTDVGTAIGTQLLNSAVGTGLSSVTGDVGLSTADAKLLNSVLTPVVTQLVTNGNVNDATLMNAVLLAGSTVLANTGSNTVNNVSTLTTGSDTDKTVGGLNLLANETGNETLTNLASTVNTGLGALSTATGLLNKATSLTNTPKTRINKTRANLTGALRTNTPTTRTAAVKPAALNTLNKPKTTAIKPAALGALSTTKKTLTSQQISQLKASKPPARVNVANLTAIKKPPQRVDVRTLIPVKKAQLPAGLNTKKMG
jgi:hypothetical protein